MRGSSVRNKQASAQGHRQKKGLTMMRVYVSQPPGLLIPDLLQGVQGGKRLYMDGHQPLELVYKSSRTRRHSIISQDKYVAEMHKKFDLVTVKLLSLMETKLLWTRMRKLFDVDNSKTLISMLSRGSSSISKATQLGLWYDLELKRVMKVILSMEKEYAGQSQLSAAPTSTHPVPTPSSSHVSTTEPPLTQPQSPPPPVTSTPPSITQQPPTLTQYVQSSSTPPQPSSIQPTAITPPIQL
ncbi:hypothetical protein Tco_0642978 [Tanacetum coccineum]